MVENKKAKRQRDIKAKLMAAIAMLLVSSIMMVSTTYAWFTLSTAPEVQGITTTIASNGNLEIALSPVSGDLSKVMDANTSTSTDWTVRNLTWGNLLDLSNNNFYNLNNLTLAPAQLVLTSQTVDAKTVYNLGINPLATPHYGSDGRISELEADASIGGTTMGSGATAGYKTGGDYGVRAVGTTSGMSLQQTGHKTNVANITNYANKASAAAGASLQENGNALASIMVAHAQKGADDANNYKEHEAALVELTGALSTSIDYIDDAMISALKAMASKIEDETAYKAALQTMDSIDFDTMTTTTGDSTTITAGTALATVYSNLADAGVSTDGLTALITERNQVAARIALAKTTADGLASKTTVSWTDVYGVVQYLMNTNGVTINGYTIDTIKAQMNNSNFLLGLAKDTQIQLGAGSGVYYEIAEIAGNIAAKTTLNVDGSAAGLGQVTLENVIIKTTFSGTPSLTTLKNAVNTGVTPAGNAANAVMDAFYGYVLDLVVRTNAADSHLYLQTEGTQRVYSDSANEQTMGKGATIVMTTTNPAHVGPLQGLCESIYIAFFDPSDANKILGVAKVTSVVLTNVITGEGENAVTTTTITGSLSLCSFTIDSDGLVTVGGPLTDDTTNTPNVDESKMLCALTQNVPQAISALVYLDGNTVTSADVLADENVTAILNLQFASSAELKPMENSELKTGKNTNTPAPTETP